MLIVILTILLFPLAYFCSYKADKSENYDTESFFNGLGIIIFLIGVFVCICIIVCGIANRHSSYTNYLELQETYTALEYKKEALNNNMGDILGLNNNNIVNEINSYNRSVIAMQRAKNSIWLNVFYTPYVNELKLIKYSDITFNNSNINVSIQN